MALPLLLAGPIVRRVEPRLVAVWVATTEPRTVRLDVWHGTVSAGTGEPPLATGGRETLRIGDALHVAVVTAELAAPAAPLSPGTRYSYNVTLGDQDLAALGLLADTPAQPMLGYEPGLLPAFATCPPSIEDLQVVQGSCNRPHADGPNVFFVVDELIERAHEDALRRPHQLFLTGDQVYSDDIAISLLPAVNALARELIGARESVLVGDDEIPVPVHDQNFPAGYRQSVSESAGLTSGDARCHALGLGERVALHLLHWAPEPWEPKVENGNASVTLPDPALLLRDEKHQLTEALDDRSPDMPPATVEAALRWLGERLTRFDAEGLKEARKLGAEEREQVLRYFNRVGHVRRALANVPTYMCFDDHDVTDDWNLCAAWVRQVRDSALGRSILRDGLVSFLLMQAWGNDPKAYEEGPRAELLAAAGKLFPPGRADGPDPAAVDEIERLLGLIGGQPPKVDWHFTVDGAVHRVIVCDTRTRRGFTGDMTPPVALPDGIREEQIPEGPLPAGMEMLFVVVAQPVLDSVLLGEFTQGTANRILAAKSHIRRLVVRALNTINHPATPDKPLPPVDPPMLPLHKKDYEGWSARPDEIEKLLARLATYPRVAILSGDIHHSLTQRLTYWVRQATTENQMLPASEMAQLTCSALQLAEYFDWVAAATGLQWADQLLGFGYPIERLGWLDPAEDPVAAPELPARGLRRRLLQRPVVVPTGGWPEDTQVVETPDYAWRLEQVVDTRPDGERPASVQIKRLEELEEDFPADAPLEDANGYAAVARRHAASLRTRNQTRRMLFFNNVARIGFVRDGDELVLRNELHSVNPKEEDPGPPDVYTLHEIRFGSPPPWPRPELPFPLEPLPIPDDDG